MTVVSDAEVDAPVVAAADTHAPGDHGIVFDCTGEPLVGVVSRPAAPSGDLGLVVAVGGPQYRAGSHRQFVLLARRVAAAGIPALRFDTRGMGDSGGDFPGFEALGPDLAAACLALRRAAPSVRRVVVWGLCDAASAALLNAAALPALAGLVLLNPWVRHADTEARVQVKQYYARRLFAPAFWRKLVRGEVRVGTAAAELSAKVWRIARSSLAARPGAPADAAAPADYRERMARGALAFGGPQLYILAGRDHVCAEFLEYAGSHAGLRGLWSRPGIERLDLADADHTFSNAALRAAVEAATLAFLARVGGGGGGDDGDGDGDANADTHAGAART